MTISGLPPCEVSADCFECPLSRCKHDDPQWFSYGRRRGQWYAIAEAADRVGLDAAAAHCGVSKRTVFRVLANMIQDSNTLEDRAVFAALSEDGNP